mmetsp:Transcript_47238/g.94553  ORF Transcript_47238/g.94553 Transcript_47238/m.94553 type:complete len:152 (+) Transcript_47238:93-548(+)|eukprot:CAMPEP_0196753436 /NCGR_PEP_ID=MMETSP1091-20130531/90740_1 /TAXON_ID=302021 /ORGANISM="Rhodomonas sp., Strain CCMP768" /LENGTH=151 /DNA_ID=CAMNT_0042101553 /DNA_START=81 /DNA_END=536 /DNA_ORIENTATION=+
MLSIRSIVRSLPRSSISTVLRYASTQSPTSSAATAAVADAFKHEQRLMNCQLGGSASVAQAIKLERKTLSCDTGITSSIEQAIKMERDLMQCNLSTNVMKVIARACQAEKKCVTESSTKVLSQILGSAGNLPKLKLSFASRRRKGSVVTPV